MSNQSGSVLSKIGTIFLAIGIALCVLLVGAISLFFVGMISFYLLGEERYFSLYVGLNGYYPVINLMFLLDYATVGVGLMGIPAVITGIIFKVIGGTK